MSVEWLSCLGSKWLASIGIPLLVVQSSSWLGLTWVPYPSVPSLGFHWVPASCFGVLLHDFPGSFHVYFFFFFFDILKTFSMLTFSLFHYTAHVLTTSFRVSCLIWVSSSDWSFSVSPVCALPRILLNSRILTRTHHFPGPLFSLCVPWTKSTQLPLCLLWECVPADFLWVFWCRSPLCPWSVGELTTQGIAMWSGCQIYLPTGLTVGG